MNFNATRVVDNRYRQVRYCKQCFDLGKEKVFSSLVASSFKSHVKRTHSKLRLSLLPLSDELSFQFNPQGSLIQLGNGCVNESAGKVQGTSKCGMKLTTMIEKAAVECESICADVESRRITTEYHDELMSAFNDVVLSDEKEDDLSLEELLNQLKATTEDLSKAVKLLQKNKSMIKTDLNILMISLKYDLKLMRQNIDEHDSLIESLSTTLAKAKACLLSNDLTNRNDALTSSNKILDEIRYLDFKQVPSCSDTQRDEPMVAQLSGQVATASLEVVNKKKTTVVEALKKTVVKVLTPSKKNKK